MRSALRAAALAVTALVLLATSLPRDPSCPEDDPLSPGPVEIEVDTSCGAGTVMATVEPATCKVTLAGAEALGLPASGIVDGPNFSVFDGVRRCECSEREPGVYDVRCRDVRDGNAVGCGGSDLPACNGTMRLRFETERLP